MTPHIIPIKKNGVSISKQLRTFTRNLISICRYLYTLAVRDEFGSWIPCAHFLTERLEAGIIIECLKKIRDWCGGEVGGISVIS